MTKRVSPWRKRYWAWFLIPVFGFMLLRWFEHRQVYQPSAHFWAEPTALGWRYEQASFTASDGIELHGWFFPAPANSIHREVAVLHCHGNGGNISHRLEVADALRETGVNVLLFDYRGYGRSGGRPSEAGTYLDAEAARAWLSGRGFADRRIVAFGESLGGGVVSELALRRTVGALVLQSTFTSVPDLGVELFPFLPVRLLARIRYDTQSKLPRIRVPVAVLHGRADTLVRFDHAERNFAAANEPKILAELAGDHNDFLEVPGGRRAFQEGFRQALELMLNHGTDSADRAESPGDAAR